MAISHTIFQGILDSFAVINLKTVTRGFLGSVMTVLTSDVKNSKWRNQYGDLAYNTLVNSGLFCCN